MATAHLYMRPLGVNAILTTQNDKVIHLERLGPEKINEL